MKSPNTSTRNTRDGFTLIETIVVMSLIAMIGGFTAVVSLDSYRSHSFRSDRDMLVVALQRARSQSMNNICKDGGSPCTNGKSHGVLFNSDAAVIFQGTGSTTRDTALDERIPFAYSTQILPGSASEVVFMQLSGEVLQPGQILLSDGLGKTSTIYMNSEGRIWWTN